MTFQFGEGEAMTINEILSQARKEKRTQLTEIESKEFIKEAGIPVVDGKLARTKREVVSLSKEMGFPIVLKVISPDVIHKSDSGGVKLGLRNSTQAGKAYSEMISSVKKHYPKAKIQGASVQKMARPGVEVIIGMTRDAQFGPVTMFGIGGISVEILKDVSFRVVPVTKSDALEMIREIKGYPLLEGYRGQEAADIDFLVDLIARVSEFVEKRPEIKELDLNPIFAYDNGAIVVDARVILEPPAQSPDEISVSRKSTKERSESMKYFFQSQSVAVVGASGNPKKDGHIILKNMIDSSFSGKIFPVNPNMDEILGLKAYPSLLDIPGKVDLVVIIIPARFAPQIMEDCAKKGVKAVIIEAMGFGEIGVEGKKLQDKIVDIAVNNGIRVMGPNCTGIVSKDLVTSFYAIKDVSTGNVGMIGQSGLLAAGMASDIIVNKSLNIRRICSIGNKCDVNENDLLGYFGDDDDIEVISAYLESISDGQEFIRIAKKVTPRKPVIVLYGGRTEAGAKAALSHTGSIASNAKIVDAALRQSGCIKADDFSELKDFAKVFSTQPVPQGNRIAVVTAAGSVGVVISDLCEGYGLELPGLTSSTVEKLKEVFPQWMQPKNPVDLWFSIEQLGFTEALTKSMNAALSDPNIDGVILVLAAFEYTLEVIEKKMVQQIANKYGKPIITCTLVGYKKYGDILQDKLGRDMPVFTSLNAGVKALGKLCEYGIRVHKRDD